MITEWQKLTAHHQAVKDRAILDLFATGDRAAAFSARCGEMLFDWSKTNIDTDAKGLLLALAEASGVAAKRHAMFTGDKINDTEGRAVLHTALRNPDGTVIVDGKNVIPGVQAVLAAMAGFADDVRSGRYTGQGGKITDVVNIGIGGSDLGPAMATLALAPYHDGPRFETMTNAETARVWMAQKVAHPAAQFAAVSTAQDKTAAFGIDPERVFGFEDWVGGRYSMWGPIGLSLMIAVGPDDFRAFLAGGRDMDLHFLNTPFEANLPVLLALVGIWHNQICGHATRAVLPYDQRLSRLPAYLQQLEMESNGKRVAMDGSDLPYHSGPVVWGEPGTNGQHAFYQLIHQGTRVVPCEFLVAKEGHEPDLAHQHLLLVSNCLAQSEALMRGRSLDQARAIMAKKGLQGVELERQARHRVFPGNRPSTTLAYPKLTPFVLGQIIALYEHRVFVEGVILGINSYDQWGVELGKELALALQPILEGKQGLDGKDGSTAALVGYLRG
ncbi:MAG: glucose-6-phosphate isomerase [Rhodobacteraceae bacterium PARR1]|nr:MAG: glucose-6-phosphate isomerase [Rhodobacteraceae bacterium PARR1]